jgi:hypothetical protein
MLMDRKQQQQRLLKIEQLLLSAFGRQHVLVTIHGGNHPVAWLLLNRVTVTKNGETNQESPNLRTNQTWKGQSNVES